MMTAEIEYSGVARAPSVGPMKAMALILALALTSGPAMAHSGGTIGGRSPGCHTGSPNSAQPGYHCHGTSESRGGSASEGGSESGQESESTQGSGSGQGSSSSGGKALLGIGIALVLYLLWKDLHEEEHGLAFAGQSDGTSSELTVTKEWRW